MKTYLSLIVILCWSIHASSQQWTYAARYGGAAAGFSDAAKAVCTDASGNVYVTGNFNNSINFGNGTATLTPTAGGTQTEGFVAKFDPAGLCQWSIDFGGAASDLGGLGIITDGTAVYVTGQSQFPSMIGSTALATVGGGTDGVVFALNAATGATIWARAFGGGATGDMGQSVCMDNTGRIYISGVFSTRTTNPTASFGTAGAFPRTVQGSMAMATSDLFVAQLDAATGTFNWVSTGGAASLASPLVIGNDNISGSGIAFVPSRNELIMTGSFANATATYFSNGSATPAFSLTNAGQSDIALLKLDLSGNFLSGLSAGGTSTEEGLAISYDAATTHLYITGAFNSAAVSGAFSLTNTAGGFDEIYYARYNPATNTFAWARSAAGSASGNDMAFSIATGANGVYVTGRFQGAVNFPTGATPLTASATGFDDVFLVKLNPANGNATQLAIGNSTTGTDAGMSIAIGTGNNVWVGGIFAGSTLSLTPSSPPVSVTVGVDQELFIARYNDPPPVINTQPSPSTMCRGLSASFTVIASGSSLTYQWQESTDAIFSSPVTLTNAGIYSGTATATLTISDNATVNGRYYRVLVSSSGGTTTSNGVLLTATSPALPAGNATASHAVNTANNFYYAASCGLIATVVPSGASPVTGTMTTEVWVEPAVTAVSGQAFVQRHYQITPGSNPLTSTATLTLYFSQAEFDAFNAAPESSADLPSHPSDNAGKANLRIGKYSGSSNNGSGLPGSYTSSAIVIDPPDGNIVWNAVTNMWEVSLDVAGFSGFVIQTNLFVLPVNLLSFSGQLSGTAVQLQWKTAEEINHDHFEIERSIDGRSFQQVANVASTGGSGIHQYNYTDADAGILSTSKIYYRLKMVDVSGAVEYGNTIIIFLNKPSHAITAIGPNPFTNKLNLNVQMPAAGRLMIKLTDIYGRTVHIENAQAPKGSSTHSMDMKALPAGMYILLVETEGKLYSWKILKSY